MFSNYKNEFLQITESSLLKLKLKFYILKMQTILICTPKVFGFRGAYLMVLCFLFFIQPLPTLRGFLGGRLKSESDCRFIG